MVSGPPVSSIGFGTNVLTKQNYWIYATTVSLKLNEALLSIEPLVVVPVTLMAYSPALEFDVD